MQLRAIALFQFELAEMYQLKAFLDVLNFTLNTNS